MLEHDRPKVPPAEGFGPKEVFAFFGLCAYQAQVLEHGLLNLAVALKLRGLTRLSFSDIEQAFLDNERNTLGQLINDVRLKVSFPEEVEVALRVARQSRNYLVHRFFATHGIDFLSEPGRQEMVEELREMTLQLQATDRDLEHITRVLWELLGMTDEILERALREMQAEAAAREDAS